MFKWRGKQEAPEPVPDVPDLSEASRLEILKKLDLASMGTDQRFERLVILARDMFRVPVVRVSFVDEQNVWFKARIGIEAEKAPQKIAICARTIQQTSPMIVPDLTQDDRFRELPQVTGRPHFRFYAGAPVIVEGGLCVASFCLMDYKPRWNFTASQTKNLQMLAEMTADVIELNSALQEAEQARIAAREEAFRFRQHQQQMFAMIGSELCRPLHTIAGLAATLKKTSDGANPETVVVAEQLTRDAERLNDQVSRLQSFSEANPADKELNTSEFDLCALAADCVELARYKFGEDCPTLSADKAFEGKCTIEADRGQVGEALYQILLSCLPHPGAEGVLIRLERGDAGEVVLQFHSAGAVGDAAHSIGLTLASTIAIRHGGDLSIEPSEIKGQRCIRFTLPEKPGGEKSISTLTG